MENGVSFGLRLDDDGGIQRLTVNAKELGGALKEVRKEAGDLNSKMINLTQTVQAVESLQRTVNTLRGALTGLTRAWAAQETAERKLATVMRNTMSASDDEIAGIKALCAAQQQLGVIGDEVQLAGAQELATYLKRKETLETLIPVMNDMVAQQYGLNATQESAAQIATMLGKVMEGQTTALSRYGYSFTEAEEQILKFGTEADRAAVLAKVVGQSVGGGEGKQISIYNDTNRVRLKG